MSKTIITQILTRSYPAMPQELEILAERIREIEGFYVNLDFLQKPRSESDISPGRYNYERAGSSKMNVGKWIEKRFEPHFPFLKAQVVTSEGRPAFDDELLNYVRGANSPWLGHLEIKVESKKDTPSEKNDDLKKLKLAFASFEIFSQRGLINEAWRFLKVFNGHKNELNLKTKPINLRDYEIAAIESILKRLIFSLGYEAEFERTHLNTGFISSDEYFTSRDLNNFVPTQKQSFVKKTLGIS